MSLAKIQLFLGNVLFLLKMSPLDFADISLSRSTQLPFALVLSLVPLSLVPVHLRISLSLSLTHFPLFSLEGFSPLLGFVFVGFSNSFSFSMWLRLALA